MAQNKLRRILYSQKIAPYVFILPFILCFLIFFLYPFINTLVMSFQRVSGDNTKWVALDNYKLLLNPIFRKSVLNSLFYMIASCLLVVPIPMVLAAMLNSKYVKCKGLVRGALFIPALTSVVVAGTIFRLMFGELENSFMNQVIGIFGQEPIVWLRQPTTVWIAMLALCMWRWTGVNMVYYLAGLQQIDNELYEAADIDGADGLQKFRYITVPLLRPTRTYVLTISIYGGLAMFTESFILFNGNQSPNNVGTTIVGYLYRMGWEQNNIGLASAVGVTLLIMVVTLNVIQLAYRGMFRKENE